MASAGGAANKLMGRVPFLCAFVSLLAVSAIVRLLAVNVQPFPVFAETFTIGTAATAPLPVDFRADRPASTVRTVGTYAAAGTATTAAAGTNMSSSAAQGIYNFGAGASSTATDRAVGFLSSASGTASGNLYLKLTNTAGAPLAGLQIAYGVEKYRNGSNPAGFRYQLFYSFDGSTWTDAGSDFLTAFAADANNNGASVVPTLTVPVSATLNVPIAAGQDFYLAWNYSVSSGSILTNAEALAIDDVSIAGLPAPGPALDAWMGVTPSSVGSGSPVTVDVVVAPAINPASTGITVTADLSGIGGSSTQSLGNVGGNRFTFSGQVAAGTAVGTKTIVATAHDAQGRSATASAIVTVLDATPISTTVSASPSSVAPGGATTITAIVTPGAFPASSGISVSGDLSAIGGGATQVFTPGANNRFTFTATVPSATVPGEKTLKVTASDAQGRTATATTLLTVLGPAPRGVVISQVYGGGGDSGGLFQNDYIELYNTTANDVSLAGWSVQYASATGASWSATPLSGVIKATGYYLVKEASAANVGVPLPPPDASGTIAMSAASGKVALVNASSPLGIGSSCPLAFLTVADFVGYGSANCFEGAAPAGMLSETEAALRLGGGATDTDDNGADFEVGLPLPRGSSGLPPTGFGVATPQTVPAGMLTTLTVTVTPGTLPASTALSVTADLSSIGGPATAVFVNDGSNTFTFAQVANAAPAVRTITAAISDAQSRTSFAAIRLGIDEPITPIHDIQGPGTRSPLVPIGGSEYVTTTGIITALTFNGVFIQTPDSNVDADPSSSEGLFVFTSTAPPSFLHVGDAVVASGTLQEFVPTADPLSPPRTELVNAAFRVLSSSNTLPAPVVLLPSFTTTTGGFEQLERFEGMRVKTDLVVVAPTQGSVDEPNATSTSTGLFYGVIKGVARPMREPGLAPTEDLPAGAPATIPRFDGNPERIRVDSDAQIGASKLEVVSGQTFTDFTGVLDYASRSYMILPDRADAGGNPWIGGGNANAVPVPVAGANEFTVTSFNLQRFFDSVDDAGVNDVPLTAAALDGRLKKASEAIRHVLRSPDVLGVVEVENLPVLQALAARIGADAIAAGEVDPQYEALLLEGNDADGIDVGLLVKRAGNRVSPRQLTQIGSDELFTFGFETSLLNDRPSLVLEADLLNAQDGRSYPVTVIVNHLLSLNGIDGGDGDRIRHKRQAQAEFLANYIQARQLANPAEWIVSVGDYNAFQFNDGYVDVMGTITGAPAPASQVVLASDDLVNPNLTNLVTKLPIDQQYSFIVDGNAEALDHILVNEPLLKRYSRVAFARVGADFPEAFRGDFNRPERISDHDAPVAFFTFPGAPSLALNGAAEMSVEYNSTFVDPGVSASDPDYPVTVTTTGSVDTHTLGTYTITYTATNGFVSTSVQRLVHVVDTIPPVITLIGANPDTVEAGTPYTDPGATATDERAGDLTSAIVVTGSVGALPGTYTLTYTVSDGFNSRSATRSVRVVDTTPPVITGVTTTPGSLGTPNHKLYDVTVGYAATDFTGEPVCTLTVASSEPVNGPGDGNTSPDWHVVDPHHVQLRAERSGPGRGRTYTIAIRCTDAAGNAGTEYGRVTVPK